MEQDLEHNVLKVLSSCSILCFLPCIDSVFTGLRCKLESFSWHPGQSIVCPAFLPLENHPSLLHPEDLVKANLPPSQPWSILKLMPKLSGKILSPFESKAKGPLKPESACCCTTKTVTSTMEAARKKQQKDSEFHLPVARTHTDFNYGR